MHGTVKLANTGQSQVMQLNAFDGGEILLYDPNTSQYTTFTIPNPITITSAANNGSGLIRLALAANSRTFNAGERINVLNTTANPATLTDYLVTPIDATHIDLQGSSFSSSFAGTVTGAIVGNVTNIRKGGVANGSASTDVNYGVFARWADSGCTWVELSIGDATNGCWTTPSLNGRVGFPTDTFGDNGTLVGWFRKKDIGAGATIQGNGNYNLLMSWYNPHWMELQVTPSSTVTSTSWAEFNGGRIGFLTWSEATGGGADGQFTIDAAASFVSAQYGYVGIGVNGYDPGGPGLTPVLKYTVPNPGPTAPAPMVSAAWFPTANDNNTIPITLAVNNNIGGGWYEYAFYGKSQGPNPNTLRNGVLGSSVVRVRAQF